MEGRTAQSARTPQPGRGCCEQLRKDAAGTCLMSDASVPGHPLPACPLGKAGCVLMAFPSWMLFLLVNLKPSSLHFAHSSARTLKSVLAPAASRRSCEVIPTPRFAPAMAGLQVPTYVMMTCVGSLFPLLPPVRTVFTGSQRGRVGRDLCGSPSPTPCPSRVTQSRLHRTLCRRGWNISREGDSTASLGSLGQGSVTLRGKKFFLMCWVTATSASRMGNLCLISSSSEVETLRPVSALTLLYF